MRATLLFFPLNVLLLLVTFKTQKKLLLLHSQYWAGEAQVSPCLVIILVQTLTLARNPYEWDGRADWPTVCFCVGIHMHELNERKRHERLQWGCWPGDSVSSFCHAGAGHWTRLPGWGASPLIHWAILLAQPLWVWNPATSIPSQVSLLTFFFLSWQGLKEKRDRTSLCSLSQPGMQHPLACLPGAGISYTPYVLIHGSVLSQE